MSIVNIFGTSRLKPHWSFSTTHILWRFLVSDDGLILGEDRDTDAKTVSFFCIDMKTGAVLWRGRTFTEPWWIGTEALVGTRLYLHGFSQPDMPEHHGLIALDARTGNEAWQNGAISFYAADADRVIGYRDLFERRVFEHFDAATGAFLGEIDPATADTAEMRRHTFGRTDFIYAEPLTADDMDLERIRTSLAKHGTMPEDPQSIEYARTGSRLVISAYLPHPAVTGRMPMLKNILCVVNSETGREEFFDVLNAETPYPVPDSFFIDNGTLYYLKGKRTLCALHIE